MNSAAASLALRQLHSNSQINNLFVHSHFVSSGSLPPTLQASFTPFILLTGWAAKGRQFYWFLHSSHSKEKKWKEINELNGQAESSNSSSPSTIDSMKFHQLLKYFHCLIPLITVIILLFIFSSINYSLSSIQQHQSIEDWWCGRWIDWRRELVDWLSFLAAQHNPLHSTHFNSFNSFHSARFGQRTALPFRLSRKNSIQLISLIVFHSLLPPPFTFFFFLLHWISWLFFVFVLFSLRSIGGAAAHNPPKKRKTKQSIIQIAQLGLTHSSIHNQTFSFLVHCGFIPPPAFIVQSIYSFHS